MESIKNLEIDLNNRLEKKVNHSEFVENLTLKVDYQNFQAELEKKAEKKSCDNDKSEIAQIKENEKRHKEDYIKNFEKIYANIDEIKKDLSLKSTHKDVYTIQEMKLSIKDFDKKMKELELVLDNKPNIHEINKQFSHHNEIIEVLCTENCIARWIWKSGKLKGNLVPWEVEVINNNPNNFLLDENKISIILVIAGLYEIKMGFFANKKPNAQVLVNNEAIISAINTAR